MYHNEKTIFKITCPPTLGLTNKLPVTLNIRDSPKGVHTVARQKTFVQNIKHYNKHHITHYNERIEKVSYEWYKHSYIHLHNSSKTPNSEIPE